MQSCVQNQAPITTSIFELFKAGPGPSSSHTIAPMRAGLDFRSLIDQLPAEKKKHAAKLEIVLLGSLSATGKGHGTPKAILAGLLGYHPASCPDNIPAEILELPPENRCLPLAGQSNDGNNSPALHAQNNLLAKQDVHGLILDESIITYGNLHHEHPYSNTMLFRLLADNSESPAILERTYYSVGGGFLQWEGWKEPTREKQPFPFSSASMIRAYAEENGLSIPHIIVSNEMGLTGKSRLEIYHELDEIIEIMRRSVMRGIRAEGMLPGTLGVYRKAAHLARKSDAMDDPLNRFLGLLNAYAFAVSEENAAGGIIVTAPTCGSAGVIASVLTIMEGYLGFGPEAVRDGLLAAAAVGLIARHNAGIAGAEVGCQGEIGVASAMAAAMLAQAKGFPVQIVENAAEIALEHHLGLTCDPVGGYVQIPCIERNAMGALKAYNASLVASAEDISKHRVTLDAAIKAMGETGKDMNVKYKETSTGGLATSLTEC